jgi:NADPH2:quinone reductase
MQAWQVTASGDPAEVLSVRTVAAPVAGPGQVVIDVKAAGLNFADILMCQGRYQERPALPFTPGLELAGTVAAVGDHVTAVAPGDRIAALTTGTSEQFGGGTIGGALAEQIAVRHEWVVPIPPSMSFTAAAALLINYGTGWYALHDRSALATGDWLLVHAGAGGVGSAAIQLGRAAGARVIATAGGDDKVALCRELGAELAIDYRTGDFVARVKEHTDGHGVDVVYDPVGGDVFDGSRRCIAWGGRMLVIGFASGRVPEVPASHVLVKNYSVVGVHFGGAVARDTTLLPRVASELMPLHATGAIDPLVFAEVPFADVPVALTLLGARGTTGKVVVSVG